MGWAAGGAAFLRRAVVQPMAGAFERAFPNRANHGLYAGKEIGFGNKVSFSQRKFVSPPLHSPCRLQRVKQAAPEGSSRA